MTVKKTIVPLLNGEMKHMKLFQNTSQNKTPITLILTAGFALFLSVSCGKPRTQILVDGSSTVFPITEAVAESYLQKNNTVNVTVGTSGTGGGFKKFCHDETDISDASRVIKGNEIEMCKEANIEYVELPVAYDGLAVIVSPENDFIKQLTPEQLHHIFRYENPARTWDELDPSWPEKEIKVFSPGQDSGTYDYFVEAIIGKDGRVRSDATFSEDDNVLVTGISGEKHSIGFFGLAYFEENKDQLRVIPVVNPKTGKAVKPGIETVKEGEYAPLSRPLFIYVKKGATEKKEVLDFVRFYLDNAAELSKDVGYVPLGEDVYELIKKRFEKGITGTAIGDEGTHGRSLKKIYAMD